MEYTLNLELDLIILEKFLSTWPVERIAQMTLSEYTSLGNKDTFTYYVENETKRLGSIKGLNSIQFGIYKSGSESPSPKRNQTDGTYIWRKRLNSKTANEAFEKVKKEILDVIRLALTGDFEGIDAIEMYNMYKWKVAFLYSNQAFIPIYNKEALVIISSNLGLIIGKKTKTSQIHKYIMDTKPFGMSVFEYMRILYDKYEIESKGENETEGKRLKRASADNIDDGDYLKEVVSSQTIVKQFHKSLQKKLIAILKHEFPNAGVFAEENYIDVKLDLDNEVRYYEIKTDSKVEECIRQGLGQLLSYVHFENDNRIKKIFICGKSSPNKYDLKFIHFIKNQLVGIEFDYFQITE